MTALCGAVIVVLRGLVQGIGALAHEVMRNFNLFNSSDPFRHRC
jgi:hypothetical protein